jgi:hypothetical protein
MLLLPDYGQDITWNRLPIGVSFFPFTQNPFRKKG